MLEFLQVLNFTALLLFRSKKSKYYCKKFYCELLKDELEIGYDNDFAEKRIYKLESSILLVQKCREEDVL